MSRSVAEVAEVAEFAECRRVGLELVEYAEYAEYAEVAELAEVAEYAAAGAGTARTTPPRAALAVDRWVWEGARVAFRRPCGAIDGEGARRSPRGPVRAPRAAGGAGWAYVANVPSRDLVVDPRAWVLAAR